MGEPRDERVTAAYRELPGEGPPPALDAAIQAAARRAVGSRPGGTRRWQVPISIAAVLALAIGVSLQVERKKPLVVDGTPVVSSGSAEYPVAQAEPEREERPATKAAPAQPAREKKILAKEAPAPASVPVPAAPALSAAPATQPPAPARAEPMQSAPQTMMRAAPQAMPTENAGAARDSVTLEKRKTETVDSPERQLERIAQLRAKGQHEEADRALAEFRRANPDYRIGEEWLRKVERR
jgi:hypothetical protein